MNNIALFIKKIFLIRKKIKYKNFTNYFYTLHLLVRKTPVSFSCKPLLTCPVCLEYTVHSLVPHRSGLSWAACPTLSYGPTPQYWHHQQQSLGWNKTKCLRIKNWDRMISDYTSSLPAPRWPVSDAQQLLSSPADQWMCYRWRRCSQASPAAEPETPQHLPAALCTTPSSREQQLIIVTGAVLTGSTYLGISSASRADVAAATSEGFNITELPANQRKLVTSLPMCM